ncbi:sensor histidine kinase [Vibrio sinensis]|uniref:histidine kinase n=1 Tax=Vibrio sinensis TaxID=2302434 RepID=A0A3A6QXB4_9VIBR|nr:HAMP domain-containing sensor histidine kinase [Vibrio sinensis]RJX73614.1 sensor histidine kinase [Vibrio sinensis]
MDKATELKHKDYPSIYRKIRRSFAIMIFVMFSSFWTVIYFAENQIEIISLHHWLDTEASRYIADYQEYGEQTMLPHKSEFSTYWSENSHPTWLNSYNTPGFYEHVLGDEDKHFLVIEHPSGRGLMYIVFQDDADDYLDAYEFSLHNYTFIFGGLISLIMVLYGLYVVRSLSRPLTKIEQKISQMPPDQPMFDVETAYSETRHIEQALLDSKSDILGFFQREKEFSRFASHELRTPIMVISGSVELLAKVPEQPPVAIKAINRIQHASEQMRVLTEAFLLLGKERIDEHHIVDCCLQSALENQLHEMAPLFAKQDSSYQCSTSDPVVIQAPDSFVSIVINNLIKNAFSYSVGDINILLEGHRLVIVNRHEGNETYNAGYGCGLVIVQRICERMHWSFSTQDSQGSFSATILFTAS